MLHNDQLSGVSPAAVNSTKVANPYYSFQKAL